MVDAVEPALEGEERLFFEVDWWLLVHIIIWASYLPSILILILIMRVDNNGQ